MMPACEHCGIPDKALWLSDCRYADALRRGGWPEHDVRLWQRSGAAAPCDDDAFMDRSSRRNRSEFWYVARVFILTFAVGGALFLAFTHPH